MEPKMVPPRTRGNRDFVLSPELAETYRRHANALLVVGPSERLDAFTTCARYVVALVHPTNFPLAEVVDRLWTTAEATGLILEYGEDAVQERLVAALADPVTIDEHYPELAGAATDEPILPVARARRQKAKQARFGGSVRSRKPPTGETADFDDSADGPLALGCSVEALNREYALVKVGSQAAIFQENPSARLVEHQLRMLGTRSIRPRSAARPAPQGVHRRPARSRG
jgi:hypothetical protein